MKTKETPVEFPPSMDIRELLLEHPTFSMPPKKAQNIYSVTSESWHGMALNIYCPHYPFNLDLIPYRLHLAQKLLFRSYLPRQLVRKGQRGVVPFASLQVIDGHTVRDFSFKRRPQTPVQYA